jgi:superfamily II DNA or RNA helicase
VSFESLLSQLDPAKRGPQFERLCRWYLTNAPEYRGRFKRVWLWAEWPDAWGPDAGIDLVAEEHDGDLWAIQAKAYHPAYAIKKADVDSFLSESSRPQFSYRLLIATTDLLGPTARRTLDAQREPVGYVLRSQLDLAPVAWPASPDDLRPRRPPRKKPFPHVREAIRATVRGFKSTDRGQLLMACGTGKTLAAMWIAERLGSKRTLILVPSLSLLAQTLREWSANATEPFDYLAVCSDETVVGEDKLTQHTAELGLPVTTDPERIAAFLRRRGRRVVFATYQSSPQIAAAYEDRTPAFDLAVADEAHRCAARVSTEFATILDAAQIKARRRLFMTATPRFFTPRDRSEAGQLDVEVASMDDEAAFGPVLHRLSFAEAIERELLSDYQVVVVGVDHETYRSYAERGEFVTRDGKKITDARTLGGQIALAKTTRKYDLHRVISFHGRVKAAREFSAEMPGVIGWMPARARPTGAIWSEHVSGMMTSGRRDRLLLRFRNLAPEERGLLSNARCLGEGVDVPSIDGVAFIDPRRSTIDIVQALGRAIRKAPDKRLGTIVLPVFLSGDEDPDQVLDESAFKHVWDVLKALRAHDEALGEELDELRHRLGARRSPPRRPGKIKLDVPADRVGAGFVRAFDARLVEQTTASWEFWLGLLQKFVQREGHARVPAEWREEGHRLGVWANHQRRFFDKGQLDPARRKRLESFPGWYWDMAETLWEEGYACLLGFVEREGHSRVPTEYRDDDGHRLGGWVAGQRTGRKRDRLTGEQIRRLEALPGWAWDSVKADREELYARLLRFVEREGHARVPRAYCDDDGYRLGAKVNGLRARGNRGQLGDDQIRRLEALAGWTWYSREADWEEGYAHLRRFVERESQSEVPVAYCDDDGFKLGDWVRRQRGSKASGQLSEERIRRLEALPGWTWDPYEARWEEGFAHLEKFVEREDHSRVPKPYRDDDGYRLGGWVNGLRQRRKRGELTDDRIRRLEALPGWTWDPHEARWEEGYARLVRFAEREGHCRVPKDYRDDGYQLGAWVNNLRAFRRRGRLSEERAKRLEALPGWVWVASKKRVSAGKHS